MYIEIDDDTDLLVRLRFGNMWDTVWLRPCLGGMDRKRAIGTVTSTDR
jgi:hypothetical protein